MIWDTVFGGSPIVIGVWFVSARNDTQQGQYSVDHWQTSLLQKPVDLTKGHCLLTGEVDQWASIVLMASTCFKALLAGRVLSFFVLLLGFDLLAAEAPFTPVEGFQER
ncbi:hypothetical protein Tco_1360405 [Tanacetum coccineum]